MKEIIKELNDLKITQKSIDFLEDLPEEIYEKYFQEEVENGLDVDKHRWYETSISVFRIDEGLFIGVESVTDTFSEQSEVEDMYHTLRFFEMEAIPSVTYKIKK